MKYFIYSLGCKVNSYECSAIASLFKNNGYEEIKDGEIPDVFVINTCSVTSVADQKSRQHIRKFIKMYPNSISVVMGCYAQGNADFIFNEIKPTILIGTSNRNNIIKYINEYNKTHKRIFEVDNKPRNFCYEEIGITAYCENTRAYLKIQDGCDNFCTYCIIPFRRGKMRSRNPEFILKEANDLVNKGYKEIVLTGIHVGGYGKDLYGISFSDLVEQLLNIKGLNSLRISSIEESEIDDKLIYLLTTSNNLAKHLHIPLQSGSDTVLKRMNRKYTTNEFYNGICKIKNACNEVALSTDVIVGFPGETDEEFQQTYDFIEKCGFNMLHVFPYSPREGTIAAKLENQINPQLKDLRSKKLITLSLKLQKQYNERFVGKMVDVIVEQYKNGLNIGHTTNYIEVAFPSDKNEVGNILKIKLEKDMIKSNKND